MLISEARVATDRSGRYLVQLCKHFGHKVTAEWTDERGSVDFGWGTASLRADADALVLRAQGHDEESLSRVEQVVGGHFERFATRDELTASWVRQ
ncbi:DUF2218 domain-containing protein [Allokutzneria oryzae]|uniref:DUF2218 domain-containing protein n=1 Tax=Allokutzneria oryzae TaxID=1378989 RepID=A0ABV5ZY07_9PSEU